MPKDESATGEATRRVRGLHAVAWGNLEPSAA